MSAVNYKEQAQLMASIFVNEEFEKYASAVFTDYNPYKNKVYVGISQNGETLLSDKDDEFYIDVKEENGNLVGKITGSNIGTALIGVYRFFSELGCRFIRPGKDGEYIPVRSVAGVSVSCKERATSNIRGIIIEGACSYENVRDIIDFSPKIGLRHYRFQFKDSLAFFEFWYTHKRNPYRESEGLDPTTGERQIKRLFAECKKRGIQVVTMGHGFTAYPVGLMVSSWNAVDESNIPPETLELFAQVNGKRGLVNGAPFLTHLCYSNPEVQKKLVDYVVQYAKENPEVDIISIGMADSRRHLCECENCRDIRYSDHLVKILNLMDEALTRENLPHKLICGIYVEMQWAPLKEKLKNPDRFKIAFCPITRVYHQALPVDNIPDGEPEPYILNEMVEQEDLTIQMQYLKNWQKKIPGEYYLHEYHLMWDHIIDFGYQKIARTIYEDVRNQAKLDMHGMMMFQSQRIAVPTALPMHIFGKTLWNRNVDFDAVSREYFLGAYGDDWEIAYHYLQTLSDTNDMVVKPGGRPFTTDYVATVLQKCLAMVEQFQSKYEGKTAPHPVHARSWEDLHLYNRFVKEYIEAFLCGFVDEQSGHDKLQALCNWLWSIEDEIQERWDPYIVTRLLPVWYDRMMTQKKQEQGENVQQKERVFDNN